MDGNDKREPGLIIVWEFHVSDAKRREFETAYGTDGDWARLFRKGKGYLRTELYRNKAKPGRYFTLDVWQSRAAFDHFKQQNAAAYKALDQQCSTLTEEERFFAEYETPEQVDAFLAAHGFPCTNVRAALPLDGPTMLALEKRVPSAAHWPESAYQAIFNPDAPDRIALVLENQSQQLRGFVIARVCSKDCELENIVVDELSRLRGFGRILMQSLIATATVRRTERVSLEVRESNHAARSLYESCGFTLSGRRRGYYTGPNEDAVMYVLLL
jgi:[ribosomal protein S18]-alanine N-acetyltransferase